MSSVEIFNSGTNLLITLVALIILMLSVWYSSQDIKIGKGIRYLFVGLVLEFIGSWFGYQMNEYYQLGISINILAFLELFILLLSMMFLALVGFAAAGFQHSRTRRSSVPSRFWGWLP